jgi:hypothetical protein
MKTVTFNITTTSGGAYDSSTAGGVTGQGSPGNPYKLYAVEWVDGTLDNNVTATLSMTSTPSGVDKTLFTLAAAEADDDAWFFPRVVAHDEGAETLASGADVTAAYAMQLVTGTLKLVVAAGGNAKTGKCLVYLQGC